MIKEEIKQIIKPENGIEIAITANEEFIVGCNHGKPRSGHPEGKVIYHIKEVLENIDKFYGDDEDRNDLRFIAIIHDSFKYKVDHKKPKKLDNHHAVIARTFAQMFTIDHKVLTIIELHDEAYNAWQIGGRHGEWYGAHKRAKELIKTLINVGGLDLFTKFYHCDNATGDKEQKNYNWFIKIVMLWQKNL